jgi:YggT family protein
VTAAWLVLLGRVLMSWIDPRFEKPLGQFLYSLTEPFLAPIRKVLPQTGTFDLSPLVLLLGLGLLMRVFL